MSSRKRGPVSLPIPAGFFVGCFWGTPHPVDACLFFGLSGQ